LRTYHIYIPVCYNNSTPVPLVVLIHGTYGSGLGAEAKYGMDAYAEKYGFIVVYPDAINFTVRTWNGGSCCGQAARDGIDDVGFISSMIGVIEAQLCIDTARIFATGKHQFSVSCSPAPDLEIRSSLRDVCRRDSDASPWLRAS
jgi:polyhydroxybutyrate depolymerase